MSLRPFFSFYGGKWRDALRYPAPVCRRIVEPFAGSAGYSLRYPDRDVTLVDLDPVIAALWRYLTRVTESEVRALPVAIPDSGIDALPVCVEARSLIGFWLNKGAASPRKRPSAWMRSGVRPGSFWGEKVRARIAAQVHRIRHWVVREGSWESLGNGVATWFVDPPYEGAGRHYRCGSDGISYSDLAAWCRAREGQIIVCENEGADWLPFKPMGDRKTARKGKRSREAVWTREVFV